MQIYIGLWHHASFPCTPAAHFSATLVPLWVTREDTLAWGGLRDRGGAAGPRSVAARLWRLLGNLTGRGHFCSLTLFLLRRGRRGSAGGGTKSRRAERGGVWVQQETQRRDVINPRVPFPAPLSIRWYLFPSCHFSWFQPPAPARLWTLSPPSIQPLSPFTCRLLFCSFLSLHLSYIPMEHLGCGCQLWTHSYYYPGGSFRLQFSMKKIRPTWKNKIIYI